MPECAAWRHAIADELLQLAELWKALGLRTIEEDLAVEPDYKDPRRPPRYERHLRQLGLESRQQLLRGPAGPQEPAAACAVLDLDARSSRGGHRAMIQARPGASGCDLLIRVPRFSSPRERIGSCYVRPCVIRGGVAWEEAGQVPEYPDLTVYVEALESHIGGERLEKIRIQSPSLLKTVKPPPAEIEGLPIQSIHRMGKRLVFGFEAERFLVLHLMIAGRLHWKKRGIAIPRRRAHAAFDFPKGSLLLTEASTKKRASLHVVEGLRALSELDPGGLEVFRANPESFRATLLRERHTLKRSLTDPHLFSGIGNAYSDEILHRAGLSPVKLSDRLSDEEHARLYETTREVLAEWTDRLRREVAGGFPEKVTAFRPEMAVHGKFREPCPVCRTPVQRIVRTENEVNYCPGCQTGGKILADRALSKLLGKDWPRTIEELEKRRPGIAPE